MKHPIKLITFDLDDTLWPVDEIMIKADALLQRWLRENHPAIEEQFSRKDLLDIRNKIFKENPEIAHNLTELRILTYRELFLRLGYAAAEARSHAEDAFSVFYKGRNTIEFFPGALTLLEHLAKNHTLIGLSNGNADLKLVGIAQHFSHHHSAESIGKPKPHPEMFEAALATASELHSETIKPEQSLHIGDHPEQDVEAARRCGMNTIWVNVLNREWPKDLKQSIEAKHLSEIPQIIQQLVAHL